MLPSPLSPALIAPTIATFAAFLPAMAALSARRSFVHDPAGQVAACWLLVAINGLAQFLNLFALAGALPSTSRLVSATLMLLLPPLLTWIGPPAKRWQLPALGAWAACWGGAALLVRDDRMFHVVANLVAAPAMAALSAWALAAQVRRAPARLLRTDWFWILTGQVTYFASLTFHMPLLEALVARHSAWLIPVHTGFMTLHIVVYAVIARGMLLRAPGTRPAYAPAGLRAA